MAEIAHILLACFGIVSTFTGGWVIGGWVSNRFGIAAGVLSSVLLVALALMDNAA